MANHPRTVIVKLKFAPNADTESFFANLDENTRLYYNSDPELCGDGELDIGVYEITPGYPMPVEGPDRTPVEFSEWLWR